MPPYVLVLGTLVALSVAYPWVRVAIATNDRDVVHHFRSAAAAIAGALFIVWLAWAVNAANGSGGGDLGVKASGSPR